MPARFFADALVHVVGKLGLAGDGFRVGAALAAKRPEFEKHRAAHSGPLLAMTDNEGTLQMQPSGRWAVCRPGREPTFTQNAM